MDKFAEIISASRNAAHPTAAQAASGNYRKGRVVLHGLKIAIETAQGQRRVGKTDGEPWSVISQAHYGELVGTRGADSDPLDVFIGPWPESQMAYVINQNNKAGAFDEHKILLAFPDEESARTAYQNSYERGWDGIGSLVRCTVDQLKWWLRFGDTTKPLTRQALPFDGNAEMNETVWDSAAQPVGTDIAGLIYALRRTDADGLLLDAVTVADILEDADAVLALDALVVPLNKLERKMQQLQVIMGGVSETVKPIAMQVTSPFKQRGTTNVAAVFELSDGQTVSIFFHNPDTTPNKLTPDDEMVSWKWLLNKKDVTILVAPEKGRDLNPREVGRRIMRLADKNSARFAAANVKKAERMQSIEVLKTSVQTKEAELASLQAEIAVLTPRVEAKRATQAPIPEGQGGSELPPLTVRNQAVKVALSALGWNTSPSSTQANLDIDGSLYSLKSKQSDKAIEWFDMSTLVATDDLSKTPEAFAAELDAAFRSSVAEARAAVSFDPTTPDGYWKIFSGGGNEALALAHQDQLDHLFQGRLIAVRNALRDLGWEGEKFKALSKGGNTLVTDLWQVGAGANIVGIVYKVTGPNTKAGADDGVRDDLSLTPVELAKEVDYFVKTAVADTGAQMPDNVRRMVAFHVTQLQAIAKSLDNVIAARGHGHILATELADRQPDIDKSLAKLAEIRAMAVKNGVDMDAVVAELGGVPDFAKYSGEAPKAEAFVDMARRAIPDEFKTTEEGVEDVSAMAEDGLGIRLFAQVMGLGRHQVVGRLLDAKGQDAIHVEVVKGSREDAVKVTADKVLAAIEAKRKQPGGQFNAIDVSDFDPLRALGEVTIYSLGSENVYMRKGGKHYVTKLLEPDDYTVGQVVDLSNWKHASESAEPANPRGLSDAHMVVLITAAGYKSAFRLENAMRYTGISESQYKAAADELNADGRYLKRSAITDAGRDLAASFMPEVKFTDGKLRTFNGKFSGATAGQSSEAEERNPLLVYMQKVRQALVALGYEDSGAGNMLIKRDGGRTASIKSIDSGEAEQRFLVTVLVNGAQVHDAEVPADGETPPTALAKRIDDEAGKGDDLVTGNKATISGVAAILKSQNWVARGGMTWDRGAYHLAAGKGEFIVSEYVDGELVERARVPLVGDEGAVVKAIEAAEEAARRAAGERTAQTEDDEEQAKYTPFDRSKVKMPTAVQLSMNMRGQPILVTYKEQEGWSNGHILALHRPKLLADAIKKYHVDDTNLRKLGEDAVSRVIPRNATLKLEPVALHRDEYTDAASLGRAASGAMRGSTSSKDVKSSKVANVILMDPGKAVAVPVNAIYFGYFDKQFKKPDYFVSPDGEGAIVVKKGGEIVGVMMPVRADKSNVLRRAARAASGDGDTSLSESQKAIKKAGFDPYIYKKYPGMTDAIAAGATNFVAIRDPGKGHHDPHGYLSGNGIKWPMSEHSVELAKQLSAAAKAAALKAEAESGAGAPDATEDTALTEAKAFLQSVIDGSADMMNPDLADQLTKIAEDYADDESVMALFNQAAEAYSSAMIAEAQKALAN